MNLDPALSQFLSAEGLLTLIKPAELTKLGTPRPLPEGFYSPAAGGPVGTQVGYYRANRNRRAARVSNPLDPSRPAPDDQEDFRSVVAIGGREHLPLTQETMAALQSNQPIIQRNSVQYIQRKLQNFYSRFNEMRTYAVHSLLAYGAVWVDSNGDFLSSSSGAKYTYDPGIPTGNTLTIDGSGGTYNIGDWATTSTAIADNIRNLRQYSILLTGYDLTTVYYGANVPGYLAANTTLADYWSRNASFNSDYLTMNEIPDGFLGLNWVPVWKAAQFTNANVGSNPFGDDFLAFTPMVSDDWYELVQCGTPVPTTGVAVGNVVENPSVDSSVAGNRIQYGFHAYGYQSIDPLHYKVVAGDFFLPALKNPSVVFRGVCS